jgi:cytoplasmic iron level regulating protein YaaA (DUF328/UPF0246 family)
MLFLLSPAKTLDLDSPISSAHQALLKHELPVFQPQAATLANILKKFDAPMLEELMGISAALAELNAKRFKAWSKTPKSEQIRPALLSFNGDVYEGLQAKTLSAKALSWAQEHVVMLSGLYGALKPLDMMQPYRLEMGTALENAKGNNLYHYWGSQIAQYLNTRLEGQATPVVVNLASQEYFKSVDLKTLKARVIECVFEDFKNDQFKVISFFAKRARGLMLRYCIEKKVNSIKALEAFDSEGYAFDPKSSSAERLVFKRRLPANKAKA